LNQLSSWADIGLNHEHTTRGCEKRQMTIGNLKYGTLKRTQPHAPYAATNRLTKLYASLAEDPLFRGQLDNGTPS
jgi:hypothetical protein